MNFTSQLTAKFGRGVRLTIAAVLAVPLTIGALSPPAVATTTLVVDTSFLVDGLLTDFTSPYGPGATPDGYPTTGIYYVDHTEAGSPPAPQVELCSNTADDVGASGEKVQTGPVWSTAAGKVTPTTVDVDDFWVAAEKVQVPTSGGTTIHDFLYLGFDLCDTKNGSFTLGIFVEGGDGLVPFNVDGTATGSTDDYLIVFDFPSTTVGATSVYRFGTTNWNPTPTNISGAVQGALLSPRSSGEVAIDLTQANIFANLPGAPAGTVNRCRTLTVEGPIASLSGGSLSSDIKDLVSIDPLVIDNCGDLTIEKVSPSGATSSPEFFYDVKQVDLGPVHDQTLTQQFGEPETGAAVTATDNNTEIDAPISVDDQHTWNNVIAQPDYLLSERTPLPAGWELTSITCSYYDVFTGTYVEDAVLYDPISGYQNGFVIAPSSFANVAIEPSSCIIQNDAAGIIIEKAGLPASSTREFAFDVNGADHTLTIGESEFIPFAAGTEVTLSEVVPAGWVLDSIECFNDDGTEYGSSAIGSIDVISGDSSNPITCVFTNTQLAKLTVAKVANPSVGSFEFDITGPALFVDDFSVLAGGSEVVGTDFVAPGSYTIAETLPVATPPWSLTNVDCGDWVLGDNDTTLTLAPGADVTCTFNNSQPGRIIIDKALDVGDGTFAFTGHTFPGGNTISIVNGVEVVGDELVANVTPGVYNINETVPLGFSLVSVVCQDVTGNTTVNAAGASINVAAGETVSCLFTNTRNTGSLTLVKNWGDSTAGNTANIYATVAGPAPIDTVAPATSTAPADGVSIQVDTASGQTVTFGEDTFANGAAYNTSLSCVQTGTATPVTMGLTVGVLNRAATYVAGNTPLNVTCTLNNTLKTAGVFLQKVWADPAGGATASITAAITARAVSNSDTSVSPAPPVIAADEVLDNSAFVPVLVGDVVTFTELLGAETANYTASFACTDAVNPPVKVNDYQYTLAIAAGDAGQQPICQFTNTRKGSNVTLTKSWGNSPVNGDGVALAIAGGTAPAVGGSSVLGGATTLATSGAFVGQLITISETAMAGTNLANYTTTVACSYPVGTDFAPVTVANGQFKVPSAAAEKTISCVYTNTRKSTTVTLDKDWVNGHAGDTAPLTITAAYGATPRISFTPVASATAPTDTTGPANGQATLLVYSGETITVSEALGASNVGGYTPTLSCTGATPAPNTGSSGTFNIPTTPAEVGCIITNTRTTAQFTLAKTWTDPVGGVTINLKADGEDSAPTINVDSTSPTNSINNTITVFSGEAVNFSETFPSAAMAGYFTTTLSCSPAAPAPTTVSSLDGVLSSSITVDKATPVNATCTFNNVRKSATLNLSKSWVNGAVNVLPVLPDGVGLTIDALVAQGAEGSATAFVPASGNGASTAVASTMVYAGTNVTLAETFNAGNTGTYDVTAFTCTPGALIWGPLPTPLDRDAVVFVSAVMTLGAINCEVTNTRTRSTVTVVKNWVDPGNGPASVTISATGGFDVTNNSLAVSSTSAVNPIDGSVTIDVLSGESITVAELFSADSGQLGAAHYVTTLDCSNDAVDPVLGQYSRVLAVGGNPSPVTCTFVNTRKSVNLVLAKDWAGEVALDTASLSIETDTDPASVAIAVGNGSISAQSASITAYSGADYNLTEVLGTANTALYTPTSLVCNGVNPATGSGTTAANVLIDPADATGQAAVTCTFLNTAQRGNIIVVKNVAGADGTFNFAGSWPATGATITPSVTPGDFAIETDGQTGTVTFMNVLVPKTGVYTVSETDPRPNYDGTTLVCSGTVGGDTSTGDTTQPLNGTIDLDNGESVTCTFTNTQRSTVVVIKDAQPNSAANFGFTTTEPSGGTLLPDAFTLDDDADGTLSNTFTSVLVPANATYTVAEGGTAGWTLSSSLSNCSTGGSFTGSTATIVPAPGATVTCTFVNTADPAGLTATKSVTGLAPGTPWGPFEFVLSGGAFTGDASQLVGSGPAPDPVASWTNLVEGATYTLVETNTSAYTEGTFTCSVLRAGAENGLVALPDASPDAGFQFTGSAGAVYSCAITNVAMTSEVSVTKTVDGLGGDVEWDFEFTLTLVPDTDPTSAVTLPSSGSGSGAGTTATFTGLIPGATYVLTETSVPGYAAGVLTCSGAGISDGDETLDASFEFVAPLAGSDFTCSITNTAIPVDVSVTKVVDGGLLEGTDWGPFTFTIDPDPDGEGGQDDFAEVTKSEPTATWTGLAPGAIYTIAETGTYPGFEMGTMTCTNVVDLDEDDTNQSVTFVAPLSTVEVKCSITNTALADIMPTKTIDPDNLPVRNADGTWTLNYLLTVANAPDAGAGVYDLEDEFAFGGGVSIVDGSADVVGMLPIDLVVNESFNGVDDKVVATDVAIAPNVTHTYRVTVDVTIAVGPGTDGDCTLGEDDGTGFLNRMTISVNGSEPVDTTACAEFATLTLIKQVINDNGGNATVSQFTLTGTGAGATITGTSPVASAVLVGAYTLTETQLAGYTTAGYSCVGGTEVDNVVNIGAGGQAICTIVNDDRPVDLQLVKSDGGVTAVAGGAPFDYTISVRNVGTRNVDLGEPVTVTDVLPAGLEWVSFPANCTRVVQTLTCSIAPALLPAGGDSVVITVTVRALPGADSGTLVNKAYVTTADDLPPPNPTCPENPESNNVDCEETPIDREGDIEIVKTDDVSSTVVPGETFNYTLSVKNVGLSTILSGTEVSDDLPAQLSLMSATGGTGWSCNSSDPILCTYTPVLAPGESAPNIVVRVQVNTDAQGANILNNAVVTGAVDRDCPVVLSELALVEGCSLVTDEDDETTPLALSADLAIVKTSSVEVVGESGTFDWILTVTNNGPGAASNVVINDTVPGEVTITSVSSSAFVCSNVGNELTCTRSSLAVGASGTITISVQVNVGNTSTSTVNVGRVTSNTPDPDLTNNSDDDLVTLVVSQPPVVMPPPVPDLPATGSNIAGAMTTAIWLLLVGGALMLITRSRRRQPTA